MLILLYLGIGLVIIGKQPRCEILECTGWELMTLLVLWPLFLLYRLVDFLGELVIKEYRKK